MKKFLLFLYFLLLAGNIHSIDLGLGYTLDTGVHIRIHKFEIQSLFDKDFTAFGLRFYPITKSLKILKQNFGLYLGGELNYINSNLLDWGYTIGAFSGLDKNLFKGLHLGIDLGIFLCSLKGWEEFTDWGVVINTKLTWIFKL
ncbi:MAG: hypothetical protein RMJ67_03870 [Elusimicrobiota bacterium]|nr:hypothetical protein [Endomicrobiia bacterium]MCX7910258.1 hypothetical protein [Endomicrobiia bacterium]MDW8165628.1 hypothetical protein [Elusimicrobiota bacterium]